MCTVNNDKARCVCPVCKDEDNAPVCGTVKGVMVTKSNVCTLQRDACMKQVDFGVLHDGECIDGKGFSRCCPCEEGVHVP